MFWLTLISTIASLASQSQRAYGFEIAPTPETDRLNANALKNFLKYATERVANGTQTQCNLGKVGYRREWTSLSIKERIEFTDSVECLMSKPSIHDPTIVPGAKSRYDDFIVPHMNQTNSVHSSTNFLSWHRYLIWAFEQALRSECGYTGYLPYWNWAKYAHDPVNSPLFDGSAGSIGSNGIYEERNCTVVDGPVCVPPGEGGGCVRSGPFSNTTVNLGPISNFAIAYPDAKTLFRHNPRCLKRDVITEVSSRWTTEQNITGTLSLPTFAEFQSNLTGDVLNGQWGVHTAGHFVLMGDPGTDVYVAPADPAFYLHHAQVDRVWWIYQNQDPAARTNQIAGTITPNNTPPSRNGTIDDIIDLGAVGEPLSLLEMMSTAGLDQGPLCYVYA
ncbi:Di-copper centre-containing protein [Corynespora cassiicola Philippines]|uniref:Di-copper centre-containing protein n=1 Tax=Corynespora cassiicola Philippines TaxID=1448308 RepID=A0A2T2N831_CORCC|nr:Di-copper centre-containing protein [Corynespora cassiicola Philippines]